MFHRGSIIKLIILVRYNKRAFNLQENAFKGYINACTFYDNLLFLICSVDGLNQILEYLLIYMFYPFICMYVYFRLRSYAWSGYLQVWQKSDQEWTF